MKGAAAGTGTAGGAFGGKGAASFRVIAAGEVGGANGKKDNSTAYSSTLYDPAASCEEEEKRL